MVRKESKTAGKFTARNVALKVIAKFPEEKLQTKEMVEVKDENGKDHSVHLKEFEKALRFCRAMSWHLKQKGDEAVYASEIEFRKKHAPATATK